jgi:hypothetical protein
VDLVLGFPDKSRVPPPESNGLTSISRANCLSEASFRHAGVHLFGAGNPAEQGKKPGGLLLLTFLGQARKVRCLPGTTGKQQDDGVQKCRVKDRQVGFLSQPVIR